MPNIRITDTLFNDICDYFFNDDAPNDTEADEIRRQLCEKLDAMYARQVFTAYATAKPGTLKRELMRHEYLNTKNIPPSSRSTRETKLF
jgi:hypothetical protein